MEWLTAGNKRLDAFLSDENPNLSRARIQKLIEAGAVTVNGELMLKVAHRLKFNDKVVLEIPEHAIPQKHTVVPVDLKLPVLFEDENCMVINKPAGIAVHPGAGMDTDEVTLLSGVAFLFAERKIPFSPEAVLVHRLDKETTGCLLIAKNLDAHAELQKQFETRTVEKTYLAIVFSVPSPAKAMIDAPVGRNLTDRTKMSVLRTSTSREAQTTYTTLQASTEAALLACDLHTGRTHQIRVHLRSISHPILGDDTYFTPKGQEFAKAHDIENLCLHAWKLSFSSPSKKKVDLVCSPPPPFLTALDHLGFSPEGL